LVAASSATANENLSGWVGDFTFTPGIGLRHQGLHVTRVADGMQGSLAPSMSSKLFAALNIESPSYQFGDSNWGFSVYAYAANVALDEQWVADGGTNSSTGADSGTYTDVGTSVSGHYSYVVPSLHYRIANRDGGEAKFALGWGKWIASFSGNIILTPDDTPAPGMPTTPIDVNVTKNAYLVMMQYRSASKWQVYMSIGGPTWQQNGYDLKLEEIALVFGYTFTLF
jgi:hypothetical protein